MQQIGALLGSVGGLAAGWLLQIDAGRPWLLVGYIIGVSVLTSIATWLLPETAPRFAAADARHPRLVVPAE